MIAILDVPYFPDLSSLDQTKVYLRELSDVLKTHDYGCLVAFDHRRTDLKLCDLRILSIVKRVKVEISDVPFGSVVDVFPNQIRKLLIKELIKVRLTANFKQVAPSVVVHSIQIPDDTRGRSRQFCGLGRR